jgi:hypothetical protein
MRVARASAAPKIPGRAGNAISLSQYKKLLFDDLAQSTLRQLRAFGWLCSRQNRKVLRLLESDLRRDMPDMRKERRRAGFGNLEKGFLFL